MIRLIGFIGLIGVMGVISINPSYAFDRNAFVQGTRVVSISNFSYNINSVNIKLNSGPVSVGSNNHSLPAYQSVAQITAQIQALKEKMKSFSGK